MQTLTIEVTQDHIDRLSKAKKPVLGIAELIWNSVDADATVVDVRLNRNSLGSLDRIEVIDNGLGITMADAQEGFGHLGGSWKQRDHQTKRRSGSFTADRAKDAFALLPCAIGPSGTRHISSMAR